ncbi:replication/maintenance protein RepL [Streptomyces olivoreticuli]|uniref:replication/maintenance protein RepL n=1 Tax=Streptomyces olivoreticuli TaxID=68246 RepID=UPI002658A74B|nr:replication/maintenance protein RepL [Streptomyces olivoreticuli]WKK24311.1 replication/maintenance protein RepL [Streptomyces olivoreticuli]
MSSREARDMPTAWGAQRRGPRTEPEFESLVGTLADELAVVSSRVPRPRPVEEINIRYKSVRRPHDMAGSDGYSLTSNWFLAKIMARCIIAHKISPSQIAVFLYLAGCQRDSYVDQTQQQMADSIGAPRTTVNAALKRLCELNYVRKVRNGRWQVNPRLCFRGNGDKQNDVVTSTRSELLENTFPDGIGPAGFVDAI